MNERYFSANYGYKSYSDIVDPYHHTDLIDDWEFSYNQISSGKFTSSLNKFRLDGIEICEEKLSTCIFQEGSSKSDTLCLGIFRNIKEPVLWMGDTIEQNDIISLHPNKEIMLKTPKDSTFYALQIPIDLLLCEEVDTIKNDIYSKNDISLNNKIHRSIYNIFDTLEKDTVNKHTIKHIKCQLIDLGFDYINITQEKEIKHSYSKNKAIKVVREIIHYLHSDREFPISVEECCQLTLTTRRTLHNYFELVVGCSPSLFLKYWRLNEVRKTLLNEEINMSIGDIASFWGFWHLSQFSQDYKMLFGELPSKTLQNSKQSLI